MKWKAKGWYYSWDAYYSRIECIPKVTAGLNLKDFCEKQPIQQRRPLIITSLQDFY